jgi:NAD(P)-dependent dehydrogenase (short-subunit alcohol dehydrogenase family)
VAHVPDLTDLGIPELLSLSGRAAVVTGGARGIGAAVGRRLAQAGANVVLVDRDGEAAEAAAAAMAAETGAEVLGLRADVTDSASLGAAADRAVAEFGSLDVWVNNAGIFPTTGPAIDASDEFIDEMLRVNVRGTYAGAREAARRMSGGGAIVNLASTAGFAPAVGISAYVASKHAVVGVTKNLALEFAPLNIRVNAVAPGVILTPGVHDQLAPLAAAGLDVAARLSKNLLADRAGVPDDVARVVLFLCSPLAAWVTGVVVPVDAGALLR